MHKKLIAIIMATALVASTGCASIEEAKRGFMATYDIPEQTAAPSTKEPTLPSVEDVETTAPTEESETPGETEEDPEESGSEEPVEETTEPETEPEETTAPETPSISGKNVVDGIDFSPIFDADWYLEHYADVRTKLGNNPSLALMHFVMFGIREGRSGNGKFKLSEYKAEHPEVVKEMGYDNMKIVLYYLEHYEEEQNAE